MPHHHPLRRSARAHAQPREGGTGCERVRRRHTQTIPKHSAGRPSSIASDRRRRFNTEREKKKRAREITGDFGGKGDGGKSETEGRWRGEKGRNPFKASPTVSGIPRWLLWTTRWTIASKTSTSRASCPACSDDL